GGEPAGGRHVVEPILHRGEVAGGGVGEVDLREPPGFVVERVEGAGGEIDLPRGEELLLARLIPGGHVPRRVLRSVGVPGNLGDVAGGEPVHDEITEGGGALTAPDPQ